MEAVQLNNNHIVKLLIKSVEDREKLVNTFNVYFDTPLIMAARNNSPEMI
jgi:ankyrin repeat protein